MPKDPSIDQFEILPAKSILFEDPHLLVVNKPAPLLTQAPPGIPNLETLVKNYIRQKYAKPAGVYLGVPHRLDRPVSGVIVFARNTKAAQRIHAQFEARTPLKTYWAAVCGMPSPTAGCWEDWVRKVPEQSQLERVPVDSDGAKYAALDYLVLAEVSGGCILQLSPQTGRMHQLRAQCGWRGFPIWGDQQYGSTIPFGPQAELPRDRIIALHARQLTLEHPITRQSISFTAPLPDSWPFVPKLEELQ